MNSAQEISIANLYKSFSGEEPLYIKALPSSGSYRQYYRIQTKNDTVIGVYNDDYKENLAFVTFTNTFVEKGLKVPRVLAENLSENIYLLDDLGDATLLQYLSENRNGNSFSADCLKMYKKVIDNLPLFQIIGGETIDFSKSYPRHSFDKQSMMWDLNYFKYYFLKLAKVPFDEQKLEDDFQLFSDFLLQEDCSFFLYRDFQSRNIMIVNDEPYFIDYQGGRRGALQYDIASLLFEAKTALTPDIRNELLEYYLSVLSQQMRFDREKFLQYFYGYVYIRIMQAMGAYGFRGLYEKKELFLQSIPNALEHLEWLQENATLPLKLPELTKVWKNLITSKYIRQLAQNAISLKVNINSFSFKRGAPIDESQNGGGFVFDCRALPNPGRYEEFKTYTGMDQNVQQYLRKEKAVDSFLEHVFAIVDQSVSEYRSRNFTNLMVNFGCTGGQHRSVYSAEMLSRHLKEKFPDIVVLLRHRELEMNR